MKTIRLVRHEELVGVDFKKYTNLLVPQYSELAINIKPFFDLVFSEFPTRNDSKYMLPNIYIHFQNLHHKNISTSYNNLFVRGKNKPVSNNYFDNQSQCFDIPYNEILKYLNSVKNRKLKDEKLKNAHEFEWTLQKSLMVSELQTEGIFCKDHGVLIELHGFRILKPSLKSELRKTHEIGDEFNVALNIHGQQSGCACFNVVPWRKAREVIKILNKS